MKLYRTQRGLGHLFVLVSLVIVLAALVGFYVYDHQKTKNASNIPPATSQTASRPGVIKSETFASSLDVSGSPVRPTGKFSTDTPKIYVSLSLSNAKAGQRIEYTRYLNGKFVDNGSVLIAKSGASYTSFVFSLKPGKTHPVGSYVVKSYTNGVYERSAGYIVN